MLQGIVLDELASNGTLSSSGGAQDDEVAQNVHVDRHSHPDYTVLPGKVAYIFLALLYKRPQKSNFPKTQLPYTRTSIAMCVTLFRQTKRSSHSCASCRDEQAASHSNMFPELLRPCAAKRSVLIGAKVGSIAILDGRDHVALLEAMATQTNIERTYILVQISQTRSRKTKTSIRY